MAFALDNVFQILPNQSLSITSINMKGFTIMVTILAGLGLAIEFPRCRKVSLTHAITDNSI